MATSLQHLIPASSAQVLAQWLVRAGAPVQASAWHTSVGADFEQLPLMARGQRLADAMATHLGTDFERAAPWLVGSMGRPMGLDAKGEPVAAGDVPSGFFYLAHSLYIAQHGLGHVELALQAQHALTQRFTAEFSLRPFLAQHPRPTLSRLHQWAQDDNAHVRRAASEATRPRLPWAARLGEFVRDPSALIPLLERLRDDPASYVRRSVANHLNDIGKDHPELLLDLAQRWSVGACGERSALLRHALRTLVKQGHPRALAVLGHASGSVLQVSAGPAFERRARIGGKVRLQALLHNPSVEAATALADWRVHYVKADGRRSAKVFKGQVLRVPAGAVVALEKTLSLQQMSTRTHYPGAHAVELSLNGQVFEVGVFDLV